MLADDLAHPVPLDGPPRRTVSLVPSPTEALARTVPERLVGATEWCTHPAELDVARVRGTKNPDGAAIVVLAPGRVVANQENRRPDVERLHAAGVPVWVSVIGSVGDAFRSMRRLFVDVLSVGEPDWLRTAVTEWSRPAPTPGLRALVPVWRDPWMVIGERTSAGDVLARLRLVNVFGASGERYPRVELERLQTAEADVVIMQGEPYVFSATDGPKAFPRHWTVVVPGRRLTWARAIAGHSTR